MTSNAQLFRFPPILSDLVLLLARVVIGLILIAHGWQKFSEWGLAGTGASFEQMGVPAPELSAVVAAAVELGGGVLLILGLLTPIAGVLAAVVLAGAWVLVHWTGTVFVDEGGWELVAALTVGALMVGIIGPGRISIDALFTRRRR